MSTEEEDPRDRGVPGPLRAPDGTPAPDQIEGGGAMGVTAAESATTAAEESAGPRSVSDGGPATPWPSQPPNITRPEAGRGWDRAVDLEKDPAVIPDLAEIYVPAELRAEIEASMAKYPDRRSAVIPALHAAQALHGWCSPEALFQVAAVMQVTPALLSSIASFYDMLNEEPVGRRHVYVCTGVACIPSKPRSVLNAIKEAASRSDLEDTEIRDFECLGACDMAPMASVDGRFLGPLVPGDASEIVRAIAAGETPLPGRGLGDPEYRLPWGGRA